MLNAPPLLLLLRLFGVKTVQPLLLLLPLRLEGLVINRSRLHLDSDGLDVGARLNDWVVFVDSGAAANMLTPLRSYGIQWCV